MARNSRFSKSSSMPLVAAIVVFVLGAFVQLWLARPYALGGLLIDRDLRVAAGSTLPSDMVRVGDRLVAVDIDGGNGSAAATQVADRRELALRLANAPTDSVNVSIERSASEETTLLRAEDFAEELPPILRNTFEVLRVDGQSVAGFVGAEELEFLATQASPRSIEVAVVVSGRVEGPVAIQRVRPDLLAVSWLALTLLGVAGLLLSSSRANRTLAPGEGWRLAALLLGGLACGAAGSVLLDGLTPAWMAIWYVGLAALWRAVAMVAHIRALDENGDGDPVPAFGVLALPALYALAAQVVLITVTRAGALAPLRTLSQLEIAGLAVLAAYAAADAAILLRNRRYAQQGALFSSVAGLVFLCAGGVGLVLVEGAMFSVVASAAVLGVVASGWIGELYDSLSHESVGRARAQQLADKSGVIHMLRRLAPMAGERSFGFAVGLHGEVVLVRGVSRGGAGIDATEVRISEPQLADALAMLATEGGMFPRAEGDADLDAFAGMAERIGLAVAIPLQPGGEQVVLDAFFVVLDDDNSALPDPAALAWELDACDLAVLYAELGVLASAELIGESRRRSLAENKASVSSAPAPVVPAGSVPTSVPAAAASSAAATVARPAASTPAARANRRWAEWLEAAQLAAYPVDDTEALNESERRALRYLYESDGAVLLVGEPGVGKEFMARTIHFESSRRDARFVAVDCAMIPPSVIEVELFGDEESPGLVDLVAGGSLLLKSASSLPPRTLDGLLSRLDKAGGRLFVAERYRGPDPGVPASVPDAIRRRVGSRTLHLAPLRDRPSDVARFARFFLHREAMRYDFVTAGASTSAEFDAAAIEWLQSRNLPGNFRELQTLVAGGLLRSAHGLVGLRDVNERATTALTGSPASVRIVQDTDAVEGVASNADAGDDDDSGSEDEKQDIVATLVASGGNRTVAAQRLGMTRGKLLRKIKKYGIQ